MQSIFVFFLLFVIGSIVLTRTAASEILYSSDGTAIGSNFQYPYNNNPYALGYSYVHAPYILPYAYSLHLKHHHPDHKNDDDDSNGGNSSSSISTIETDKKSDDIISGSEEKLPKKSIILEFEQKKDVSVKMPQTTGQLKYYTFSYPVTYTVPTPLYLRSQFHHQDDLGNYYYGYTSPESSKQEIKANDGITRGAYTYVDPDGKFQRVFYLSDADGFRVVATNLPKAAQPVEIPDSPDVALAKAEHFKAQKEAVDRLAEANKNQNI